MLEQESKRRHVEFEGDLQQAAVVEVVGSQARSDREFGQVAVDAIAGLVLEHDKLAVGRPRSRTAAVWDGCSHFGQELADSDILVLIGR